MPACRVAATRKTTHLLLLNFSVGSVGKSWLTGSALLVSDRLITPPEAANTTGPGPGFNRGSGGGTRGGGFEERVGAYALTEGGRFL